MNGAMRLVLGGVLACGLVSAASCKRASSSITPAASCATDSDCTGGTVCGFANLGGSHSCDARGECVTPLDPQPTMLCGCGGKSIELEVNDVDAGVYYWSGVVQGEQGFPPCGDAAIAPSSDGDGGVDGGIEDAGDAGLDAAREAGEPPADGSSDDGSRDAPTDVVSQ